MFLEFSFSKPVITNTGKRKKKFGKIHGKVNASPKMIFFKKKINVRVVFLFYGLLLNWILAVKNGLN